MRNGVLMISPYHPLNLRGNCQNPDSDSVQDLSNNKTFVKPNVELRYLGSVQANVLRLRSLILTNGERGTFGSCPVIVDTGKVYNLVSQEVSNTKKRSQALHQGIQTEIEKGDVCTYKRILHNYLIFHLLNFFLYRRL